MKLKPTVIAYFRVMAAHLVGRIQPPALSPLAEVTKPALLDAAPQRTQPQTTADSLVSGRV